MSEDLRNAVLVVTPTHDAYLDNGTDLGLTVGNLILAYAPGLVKIHGKITSEIQKSGKGGAAGCANRIRGKLHSSPFQIIPNIITMNEKIRKIAQK